MALRSGLFQGQEQNDADDGRGWTVNDQHPGMFDDFGGGIIPAAKGIAQGGLDAYSALTVGQQHPVAQAILGAINPGAALVKAGAEAIAPQSAASLQDAELRSAHQARDYSKSLTGDPRTTGSAANLVQGFSKAITEFTAGNLVGGPIAGAGLVAGTEGYARYHDLLDEGVDEATAQKAAAVTALTSGAGALLPMGMPAKFLAGFSGTGALLTQAATGTVVNTAFGIGSRYAQAKILDNAGYHQMAEQMKPIDTMNVAVDALSGAFFGGVHWAHGTKDTIARVRDLDPQVHDAASVMQDRQEIIDRAPGIPANNEAMVSHRQHLESAIESLLTDKDMDFSGLDREGAVFIRPPEQVDEARQIIHDEFKNSGVMDFADDFDAWLRGDEPKAVETEPVPPAEAREESAAETPEVNEGTPATQDEESPTPSPNPALADRPDLEIHDENGEPQPAAEAHADAVDQEAQVHKEADTMFNTAVQCGARYA